MREDSRVFYVLSWGYAGDHWFSWVAKALNAHPQMLVMMAHEGSRQKYIKERSRSERPPLDAYTAFLEDMGTVYEAIGDCWSYRPWHFRDHPDLARRLPLLFLLRHPYVWLEFYVQWRARNLRTLTGSREPLEHEWRISRHEHFRSLDLMPYGKDDVAVWASYQGMFQMNRHRLEIPESVRIQPLESLVASRQRFAESVDFLSRGHCAYPRALLDEVFSWVDRPFRGEDRQRAVPGELRDRWPAWKQTAFERIVEPETLAFYRERGGYEL